MVSGERARIAPQRHGIISRQCQRDRTKPWRNPDNPGRSISTQNLPWAPPPILYIPYLSENRFLSLSPKKPHPQNVSPGLLHPTRSHLHPCLKITPVRHEPLRVRGCSPAWVAAGQGVWFEGRGHGSLHKDMESSRDNARGNRPSPGEIREILADLSQIKACHGHLAGGFPGRWGNQI